MIKGDYIIDFVAYDGNENKISDGNCAMGMVEFDDAVCFMDHVSNKIKEANQYIHRVRIVGVFKL